MIGSASAAPVINLGTLIGRPSRLIIFRKSIDWTITKYYVLASIPATIAAGYFFTAVRVDVLRILVGLFLVSTLFQYRFGKRRSSFRVGRSAFSALGLAIPFVSTLVGGMGPVLNPFYLNYGLTKESLIATKTANSFFVGLIQVGAYSFFGLLEGELWYFGISLGLGASFGNYLGKKLLAKMKDNSFRIWVIVFMVISGVIMIYQGIDSIL